VPIALALGALELLTEEHMLGGPGYIDAASGAGILSIMFVLSIDYLAWAAGCRTSSVCPANSPGRRRETVRPIVESNTSTARQAL
jgi:hypothetical protein